MVHFLGNEEFELRRHITHNIAMEHNIQIQVRDCMIVTGLMGDDKVEEALKVSFIPANSTVEWVEDKISTSIHKYCYENDIKIVKSPVILRDVFNNEIVYSLIYTNGKI